MAFPQTPLAVVVELYTGSWVDITQYVYVREGIRIHRGFPEEGSAPEPGSCQLTLDNRDGRFSPRNPSSPLYGLIGRNTPIRVSVDLPGLVVPGSSGDYASTPDSATLDITGDLDVRADATLDAWGNGVDAQALVAKWSDVLSTQRSYLLGIGDDGQPFLVWSSTGANVLFRESTVAVSPGAGERLAVRATLDVDNGSGQHVVTFYTASTIDGPWVQLGSPVATAGTTSIFSGTLPLEVGAHSSGVHDLTTGVVHAIEVRNGIDGTVVARTRFNGQQPGSTPFVDSGGRTWTVHGAAAITNAVTRDQRFIGEVAEWPSRWDASGNDVRVPVTAQGILRRLGQGSPPKASVIRRYMDSLTGMRGYWSMEDDQLLNHVTPGLPGVELATGSVAHFENGGPPGSKGALLVASPSSIVNEAEVYNGTLQLPVGNYTPGSGSLTVGFMVRQDRPLQLRSESGRSPMRGGLFIPTDGTVGYLRFEWLSDPDSILTGSAVTFGTGSPATGATGAVDIGDGEWHVVVLLIQTNGADLNAFLYIDDALVDGAVLSTVTLGNVTNLNDFGSSYFDPDALINRAWSFDLAHLAIWDATRVTGLSAEPYAPVEIMNGHEGEQAHERVERLLTEASIPVALVGSTSLEVGVQSAKSVLDVVIEAADADVGLLYETRDELGLTFRARESLYNQAAGATLDYEGVGEIAPTLDPTDDDRNVRNRIVVRRPNGGESVPAELTTGALSTQDPPNGVGTYEDDRTLNLADGVVLEGVANWLLHLGTWDEARYPTVRVNLAALAAHGKTSLMADIAALNVGDRLSIVNLPDWLPPGPVELMVLGSQETIDDPFAWDIVLNCVPYGPWLVGEPAATDATSADDVTRYDTGGSETTAGLWLPNASGAYASTPDAAALDVTSDIDLRADVTASDWTPAAVASLVAKVTTTEAPADQRSYWFRLETNGTLSFLWSTDGATFAGQLTSSQPVPIAQGRLTVRVTFDVNNGSGGKTATFFTGPTVDGPWTQLGTPQTTAGTTSIFAGTAPLEVGSANAGTGSPFGGVVHVVQVHPGINAVPVATPHFEDQTSGTTSFADSAGLTWTVNGTAAIYHDFEAGTDTELLVSTTVGSPWTQDSDDLPMTLRCSGVALNVTAVAGTGAVQVLTADANPVNGVEKTIEPGQSISLDQPVVYAL